MAATTHLTDLPLDILVLVFPYLDPKSFLSLCSTCKAFQHPDIRLDPAYWNYATRSTFRVPNQPIVDGRRWQSLYRRLLTQSRVYSWGQNACLCLNVTLNATLPPREIDPDGANAPARRVLHFPRNLSSPEQMNDIRDLGIIADLQCGGWSTTLLTAKGTLHLAGKIDAYHVGSVGRGKGLKTLRFPSGYVQPQDDRYDPHVAIKQFSSGRAHILGLADSGKIWSWADSTYQAVQIKFLHVDIYEMGMRGAESHNRVRKVVAGWNKSSAYIAGVGILVWDVVRSRRRRIHPPHVPATEIDFTNEVDTMLVNESVTIPRTAYQRPRGASREPDKDTAILGQEVGEVTNYILLENYVVFVTHIGKLFAGKIIDETDENDRFTIPDIIELPTLTEALGPDTKALVKDIHGSFRNFGIITDTGAVITSTQDHLNAHWAPHHRTPPPRLIPSLQHTGVLSLAFGDYHFHALHSSGHITSYGTEPQASGALGLGGDGDPEGRLRGIRYAGPDRDGKLVRHAYATGRRVWFEPVKRQWIRFLASGARDPDEAKERMRLLVTDERVQGEVSEWVEQGGRDWDRWEGLSAGEDGDGLGAYFGLSVAAAGWHSGALVLVNERLAGEVERRCIVEDGSAEAEGTASSSDEAGQPASAGLIAGAVQWISDWGRWFLGLPISTDPPRIQPAPSSFTEPTNHGASPGKGFKYIWADDDFPRLKLSDGTEMPGEVPITPWKEDPPDFKLDVEI